MFHAVYVVVCLYNEFHVFNFRLATIFNHITMITSWSFPVSRCQTDQVQFALNFRNIQFECIAVPCPIMSERASELACSNKETS